MSSLLSHHNLSRGSVVGFLRGYQHTLPVSPEDWANAESLGLEVGTIIVCLEPVVPLSVSGDRAAAAETFKVTELGVVIGKDNERPIIIRITAETYELVFLEKLMLSKAQDAKLVDRDFTYTIVEPAIHLSDQQVQEIQQLGYSFARGGSRREKNAEGTGPVDPSIALLTALGLTLEPQAYKQLLDPGLFCQLVFEPGEPPSDSPMGDVKSKFRAVPRGGAVGETTAQPAAGATGLAAEAGQSVKDTWEDTPSPERPRSVQDTIDEMPALDRESSEKDTIDEIPHEEWSVSTPSDTPASQSQPTPQLEPGSEQGSWSEPAEMTSSEPVTERAEIKPPLKGLGQLFPGANTASEKTRREQLKGDLQMLLGVGGIFSEKGQEEPADSGTAPASSPEDFGSPWMAAEDQSAEPPQPVAEYEESAREKSAAVESPEREELPFPAEPAEDETPAEPEESPRSTAQAKAEDSPPPAVPRRSSLEIKAPPPLDKPAASRASGIRGDEQQASIAAPGEKLKEIETAKAPRERVLPDEDDDLEEDDEEEEAPPPPRRPSAPESRTAPSRPGARDSRTGRGPANVGTGMESLVSRLELQVTKATSNLVTQVEQVHGGLENELKKLIERVSRAEEQSESGMKATLQEISKQLDELTEESRLKVSDAAANGRYAIKQLLEQGQRSLDDSQKESLGSLLEQLTDFKKSSETLATSIRQKLGEMVDSQTSELSGLVDAICGELDKTNEDFSERLKSRFERLRDRLSYESESTIQSLERHVNSLREDLEGLCERAFDKVKSNKTEHEIGLRQLVTMYELNLSQTMNRLTGGTLIPKLREYRDRLRNERFDLEKQLVGESAEQGQAHLSELNEGMVELKQQLQKLLSESLAKIETLGEGEKERLSKVFHDTGAYIETGIEQAQAIFQEAEAEITENDGASRKLVEGSGAGTDPAVTADKEAAVQTAQKLKENAVQELQASFDQQCDKLEQCGQASQAKLIKSREKHIRSVSDAADEAIGLIRKAIQDASAAIRATQEKYME